MAPTSGHGSLTSGGRDRNERRLTWARVHPLALFAYWRESQQISRETLRGSKRLLPRPPSRPGPPRLPREDGLMGRG